MSVPPSESGGEAGAIPDAVGESALKRAEVPLEAAL